MLLKMYELKLSECCTHDFLIFTHMHHFEYMEKWRFPKDHCALYVIHIGKCMPLQAAQVCYVRFLDIKQNGGRLRGTINFRFNLRSNVSRCFENR